MCDRIVSPFKVSIRRYCNGGYDVVSAIDMHKALKERRTGQGNDVISVHSLGTELDHRN